MTNLMVDDATGVGRRLANDLSTLWSLRPAEQRVAFHAALAWVKHKEVLKDSLESDERVRAEAIRHGLPSDETEQTWRALHRPWRHAKASSRGQKEDKLYRPPLTVPTLTIDTGPHLYNL